MFVGHLAVAFAAKRAAPDVNLGWLVAAVSALDLVWPIFILTGIEQVRIEPGATAFTPGVFVHYPWSHSLVMAIVWGLALAGLARVLRVPASASLLLVGLVVSHWFLDVVTHAPDLPLWPGDSPHFGLGLWNSIPGTFLVEGAMWVAGIAIYLRGRRFTTRAPRIAFWSLVAFSTLLWGASPWSPPPPSVQALGWFSLIGWIAIPWAALADHRKAVQPGIGAAAPS
jgi:membrane-bound metal-dependent hydrolase YbcI (DUF457 family)